MDGYSFDKFYVNSFVKKFGNALIEKSVDRIIGRVSDLGFSMFTRRTYRENDVVRSQQIMESYNRIIDEYFPPKKFVEDFDLVIKRLDNTFKSHTGGIKKKLKTLREYRYKIQRLFSSVGQAQIMDLSSELNQRIGEIRQEFGVLNALLDMQEVLARNEETMLQSIINILYLLAKTLRSSSQRSFNILASGVEKEEEVPISVQAEGQNSGVVKALDKIIERLSNTCRWYKDIIKKELDSVREINLKIQSLLYDATTQVKIVDLKSVFNKSMREIDDDIKNLNVLLDVFDFIQPEEKEEEELARNEEEIIGKGKGLCCKCALKIDDSNEVEINYIRA